jgi:hypothetical protein
MDLDFNCMTDEELDELIAQIKEVKEARAESRQTDLWNNVRRSVDNYVRECGTIEFFATGWNYTLNADSFAIPGEINLLD